MTVSSAPPTVPGVSGATAVASDVWGYCDLLGSGGAQCWVIGTYGGLGDGATTSVVETPVAVKGLSGAVQLVGSGCAAGPGGAECWGSNADGELGDGSSAESAQHRAGCAPPSRRDEPRRR